MRTNIANANTFGAKGSRAEFSDLYASALNGSGTNQIGIGVSLSSVAQQFTQGNITATENPMDMAINGGGFFQLADPAGTLSYSRNGQFKVNSAGYVVSNGGQQLLGFPADANGVVQPGRATALRLPTGGIEPNQTSEITLEFKLNSSKVSVPAADIDFDVRETYADATNMTVYDTLGQSVELSYYFQKTDTGIWNVYATANGVTVNGTEDDPLPVTTLTFSEDGKTYTFSISDTGAARAGVGRNHDHTVLGGIALKSGLGHCILFAAGQSR